MSDDRHDLERLGTMLSPPDDSFDRLVTRRDRRRRGRQITAGAIALSLTAVGVFGAYQLGLNRSATPGDGGVEVVLPSTARIECGADGATVVTPEVRPQADGVHLEIVNPGTTALMFEVSSLENGSFFERAEPGTTTFTSADLAPGQFQAKCYPETEMDPAQLPGSAIQVTDQDGHWTAFQVECPDGDVESAVLDYPPGIAGEEGTPEEVARRHLGEQASDGVIAETDEIKTAGYAEAQNPFVIVVREGRTIASLSLLSVIEGGWIVQIISTCSSDLGSQMGPTG